SARDKLAGTGRVISIVLITGRKHCNELDNLEVAFPSKGLSFTVRWLLLIPIINRFQLGASLDLNGN
ncbi:hypothetical protein WA026_012246, partial [Henosepilachna vigintioctopunctata]